MISKLSLLDSKILSTVDLLGREPVAADPFLLGLLINNKSVLVTGAGGSIGRELCRQIALQKPRQIILYDTSEYGLYQILHELEEFSQTNLKSFSILAIIGNILDKRRLSEIILKNKVDTIYHAAAYKHVPLIETNIAEGMRNNVCGTFTVAEVAEACGVSNFILISTDKAVRPTSVMGASKRISEMVCQAFAANGSKTIFSMVRFGNVLGSSGSVSQVFERQIVKGGPITVTHPDVIRYFMTIKEAAQLVIQAGAMSKGGDMFILDMGTPIKIIDLAKRMAKIAGFNAIEEQRSDFADNEIQIVFSGLRRGEKLFEELLIKDNAKRTDHVKIMRATERFIPLDDIEAIVKTIDEAGLRGDDKEILDLIETLPIDYWSPQERLPQRTAAAL